MLNVFIIVEEPMARAELRAVLEQTKLVEVIGEADHVNDLLADEKFAYVDCVFLDTNIGNENGLKFAKMLVQTDCKPDIVFATVYDEYAIQILEINGFDCIMKPFETRRVHQAVERLIIKKSMEQVKTVEELQKLQLDKFDKITVKENGRILLIHIQDIMYCTSENSRTIIVTEKGSYFASESLASFEEKLDLKGFVRVHRAFIVNIEHIEELEPMNSYKYNIVLRNKQSIPVSRFYMKDVRKILDITK